MNIEEKINDLLKNEMTDESFALWEFVKSKFTNIFNRPTSSTGKYHKRKDGSIPTCGEHTYEMLYAFVKIKDAFTKAKTNHYDSILLSIVLHDMCKYGTTNALYAKHTSNKHDQIIGDVINKNKQIFSKVLGDDHCLLLEQSVRYHSGRWSTDVNKTKKFTFSDFNPETQLLHTLDMLSTKSLLNSDI